MRHDRIEQIWNMDWNIWGEKGLPTPRDIELMRRLGPLPKKIEELLSLIDHPVYWKFRLRYNAPAMKMYLINTDELHSTEDLEQFFLTLSPQEREKYEHEL